MKPSDHRWVIEEVCQTCAQNIFRCKKIMFIKREGENDFEDENASCLSNSVETVDSVPHEFVCC